MKNMESNSSLLEEESGIYFDENFTGLTGDFFARHKNRENSQLNEESQQGDMSKEYLISDISNKSKLFHDIYQNQLEKICKICGKQIVQNAFTKIYSYDSSVDTRKMTTQQRQLQINKSMFKIELLFYRKSRVRLELSFTKIVKYVKKTQNNTSLLSKRNGLKKIQQIYDCWQTKRNFLKLQGGFDKLKAQWQTSHKIQIFVSIIKEIISKYYTKEEGFEKLKAVGKNTEKIELAFFSLNFFFKKGLQEAFLKLRKNNFKKQIKEGNLSKLKLTPKFKRGKAQKKSQLLGDYGQQDYLRKLHRKSSGRFSQLGEQRASPSHDSSRFSRITKNNLSSSLRNSQFSLSMHYKGQTTEVQVNSKNDQQLLSSSEKGKFSQKAFNCICKVQQMSLTSEKWKVKQESHPLHYLRPQQIKEEFQDQGNNIFQIEDNILHISSILNQCFDRSRKTIACLAVEKISFQKSKRMRKTTKQKRRKYINSQLNEGISSDTRDHYFPEQKSKDKIRSKRKQNHSKKGKVAQKSSRKKAFQQTKSADRSKNFSPCSKISNFKKDKMSGSPVSTGEFFGKKISKVKSVIPKQWKNANAPYIKQQITHHYLEVHRTPELMNNCPPFVYYKKQTKKT